MESFVANASSKLKVVYGDTELYPGEELTPTQVQVQTFCSLVTLVTATTDFIVRQIMAFYRASCVFSEA